MRIGEVLKRSRTGQGIEIHDVEERTKIRTKYLRALESEDWELLPSPAYAKGFLRTYAQILGLDADAIVDAYRHQVESELPAGHPLRAGEPVLETRSRPGGTDPGRRRTATLVAIGLGAAVVVLLAIVLVGGDDEPGGRNGDTKPARGQGKQGQKKGGQGKQRPDKRRQASSPSEDERASVTLELVVREDIQVCLIGGGGEVLIPGQVLSAGSEERFERPRFDLRFPSGYDVEQFILKLDGKRARLAETTGPAAFEIEPGARPRAGPAPGAECR